VPVLAVNPADRQPAWQQVVDTIGNAIRSGMLAAGEPLPSVREMSDLQGVPVATLQHASHKASDLATAAGVKLNIKGLRHGQPTARGPVRPSQHRCAPRPRQRRRHHSPALC